MNKPKPKPDNPEQSKRFIDAAKTAGVDETGKEFERAFKKIAPARSVEGTRSSPRKAR